MRNWTEIGRRDFLAAGASAAAIAAGRLKAAPPSVPPVADKSNASQFLCGPMDPMVTHYNRDLSLDLGALEANLQYQMEHGFRAGNGCLLIGGAGGDFPMLSDAERKAVLTKAMHVAGNRVPVVVGAQATDERVTLELARLADDLGVFAFQVSAPYYYDPSDADVLRWFRKVNGAVKKSGIMIYNTYWKGYQLPEDVLDQLMELDRVVSLKWSTAEGGLGFMKGVARYSSRVAVIDNMFLWPLSSMLGAAGFITHLSTIWPEHEMQLYALTKSGEHKKALDIMKTQNWPWIEQRGKMGKKTSGEAPIVKAALELCGRPGGPCRPPSRELTSEERAELREVLKKIGAPVA